jgi:hypothetical protein
LPKTSPTCLFVHRMELFRIIINLFY